MASLNFITLCFLKIWFTRTKLFSQFQVLMDQYKYKKPSRIKIRTTNFYLIPFGKHNICSEWLYEDSSSFFLIFVGIDLNFLFSCKTYFSMNRSYKNLFWDMLKVEKWITLTGVYTFCKHVIHVGLLQLYFELSEFFLLFNSKDFCLRRTFWILVFLRQQLWSLFRSGKAYMVHLAGGSQIYWNIDLINNFLMI